MKYFMRVFALASVILSYTGVASAALITFDNQPNDPTGMVFSTNSNDGWNDGRGMQFGLSTNTSIDSFGVLQDISLQSGISLAFEIFDVTNNVILRSGSSGVVGTNGLEFIDVFFAPLQLLAGNIYHMEFTFDGLSNQNFFHDERGALTYNDGPFINIDSTIDGPGSVSNFVLAQFRTNTSTGQTPIPEPGILALIIVGLLGLRVSRKS